MVQARSLSIQYTGQKNLQFTDWHIDAGEKWLLSGASGSGKTTLLHMIIGILRPTGGDVIINKTNLHQLPGRKQDWFRGKYTGMVFQKPHLVKSLTVKENLLLAQNFGGTTKDLNRLKEVLSSLGIEHKMDSYPSKLSMGQLQRVSIARAVINKPLLLVADEPTSSLDDQNAEAVLDLLLQQTEMNKATLIVATHDKRVKETFSKQYLVYNECTEH